MPSVSKRSDARFDASQKAVELLARREASRRHLLPFITTFMPHYDAGWVHKDICARLERFAQDVIDKKNPRLMLFMPPRSGKSEIVSRNFPAWFLGKYPDKEIIATSYASALAIKFSRKARALVQEPEYAKIFPDAGLDPEAQSLENWLTNQGGGYMAAGVSGPITGSGFHIGIIDDPVKNDEEAQSEVTRQNHKDWYTSTFFTRQAPGAGILIIMTRWHPDDIAGWLLEEMAEGGDQFEVVSYPAIAERNELYRKKGEALHPERYPIERLHQIRKVMMSSQPRHWHALYQQKPVADEGEYFTTDMIHTYEQYELPRREDMCIYTAWDLAIGQKEANDFTVGFTVGIDRDETVWVLDRCYGKWDGLGIVDEICANYLHWEPEIIGIEKGQISMAIGAFLDKTIAERNLYGLYYEPLPPGRRDKPLRARPIQARMKQGKVRWPQHADWFDSARTELLQFPSGVHDDQVDAIAWIGQMMQMFSTVPAPKAKKLPSWRDRLDTLMRPTTRSTSALEA